MSRKQIFSKNKGLAIIMTETKFLLPSFDSLNPGLYYPQNLGSISVGHILNVKFKQPLPNTTILDMCAAPGGKTSHLFTLMKNSGNLIALDKSSSRLSALRSINHIEHLQAWGATSVNIQKMDSTQAYKHFGENFFDKVLLDAPCSGLGQRPRLNFEEFSIEKVSVYQKSLLISASRVLKLGGELVYSTCSISEEGEKYLENQENVIWALKNLPLELIEQNLYIGDRSYPESKTQVFSILEHSGFFIASFKKI